MVPLNSQNLEGKGGVCELENGHWPYRYPLYKGGVIKEPPAQGGDTICKKKWPLGYPIVPGTSLHVESWKVILPTYFAITVYYRQLPS